MNRAALLQELLVSFRSARFTITLILCIVLMPLATIVNVSHYQRQMAAFEQAQALQRAPETHAALAYDTPVETYRPPAPLSIFCAGAIFPERIVVTPERYQLVTISGASDSHASFFGEIHLGTIVALILSLMAFVFAAGVFPRELENGELRYALAGPLQRGTLLRAKFLGTLSAMLVPLLAGLVLAFCVPAVAGLELPPAWWAYGIVFFLSASIFLASQLALAMYAGLLFPRGTTTVTLLVLVWALFTLVIPGLTPVAAELLLRAKPRHVLELEAEGARNRAAEEMRQVIYPLYDSTMRSFSLDPETVQLPMSPTATRLEIRAQEKYWELAAPIVRMYEQRSRTEAGRLESRAGALARRQEFLAALLGALSPVSAFSILAAELSGTGRGELRNLHNQAAAFRHQTIEQVYSRFEKRYYGRAGTAVVLAQPGALPPSAYPAYSYHSIELVSALARGVPGILLLCAYAGIFLAALWHRFRRMEVG
jgi:ABC-type transport system involved in multi-copper enzyme maturation permease subunit